MKRMCYVILLCVLLTPVILTSCSILPQAEPTTIYQLPPATVVPGTQQTLGVSLCIARPQASGLLESARIAVIPSANTLSAYPDVRWQSPAPTLWQNYLRDALQRSGRMAAIISDQQDLYADYRLDSTIQAFYSAYFQGTAHVVIVLDVSLSDQATKRIVASRRFTAQHPVDGEQVPEVVEAFGRAGDNVAHALTNWIDETITQQTYSPDRFGTGSLVRLPL